MQTIQKIIETDFERNIHILNEFSNKLIKLKNDIIEKMNKNNNNEIDLKINIECWKKYNSELTTEENFDNLYTKDDDENNDKKRKNKNNKNKKEHVSCSCIIV